MRKIAIEEGLTVRFPTRDDAFDDGVEIGCVATLMALGLVEFSREIAERNLEQARSLGQKLGYHISDLEPRGDTLVRLTFRDRNQRPRLKVV